MQSSFLSTYGGMSRNKLKKSGSCENHVAQGVRFNADKIPTGSYYSTPIWTFRCKCHSCQAYFEIRTDPKVRLIFTDDACSANLGRMRNMWLYRALGSKSVNGSQVKRKTFFCMVRNEY